MVVGARTGLAVRDVSSNRMYVLPAGPPRWRAVADATGMHIEATEPQRVGPVDRAGRVGHLGRAAAPRRRRGVRAHAVRGRHADWVSRQADRGAHRDDDRRDGEHAAARRLSVVGGPGRVACELARPGAAVAGGGRPNICRVQPQEQRLGPVGHLRHHGVPGLSGSVQRGGQHDGGGPGHPQPDPDLERPAHLVRVLLQQRRLDRGQLAALPGRQSRPVRRGGRDEPALGVGGGRAGERPAGPLPTDRPAPGAAGADPRRSRRLGRPDHQHVRRRKRRQRRAVRDHRPARAEVDLVDTTADGGRPGDGAGRVGGGAQRHRKGRGRGRGVVQAARTRRATSSGAT